MSVYLSTLLQEIETTASKRWNFARVRPLGRRIASLEFCLMQFVRQHYDE
ncbi:hypothetical protein [Martelella sp. FOR1707]